MSKQTYFLSFEGISDAEASRYATELREALLDASAELEVQRQRKNPLTQDLGMTLVLILGAPAVVAAVQVIGNWLQKRRSVSLTIETSEKKMTVENITSTTERKIVIENISDPQAMKLLELFLQQPAEERKPDA